MLSSMLNSVVCHLHSVSVVGQRILDDVQETRVPDHYILILYPILECCRNVVADVRSECIRGHYHMFNVREPALQVYLDAVATGYAYPQT